MPVRDKPYPPILTLEFRLSEIDFGENTHEYELEEKFKQLCDKKLDAHMFHLGLDWPGADIWRAEINIGRTNDTVWSYIQTMRDDILKIYKEVRT